MCQRRNESDVYIGTFHAVFGKVGIGVPIRRWLRFHAVFGRGGMKGKSKQFVVVFGNPHFLSF